MSDRAREHQQAETTPTVLLIESSKKDAAIFEQHLRKVALHWQLIVVKDGHAAIQHMTLNGFPTVLVSRLETLRFGVLDVAEWVRSMKIPAPLPILIYDEALPVAIRQQLEKFGVTQFLDKRASVEKFDFQLTRLVEQIEQGAYVDH